MFLKINDVLTGLKHLPKVYEAVHDTCITQCKLLKLYLDNFKCKLELSRYLKCKLSTIRSYYNYIGDFHLEVLANNGIFICKSHRFDDSYPNVTVLDSNTASFKNLELLLENLFCKINFINFDINKEKIDLTEKFNSVALPFVLEKLEGDIEAIDSFLSNLKNQLNEYKSVVYGFSTPVIGLQHKKNFYQYIETLSSKENYFNKNLSVEQLYKVFTKHFYNVNLYNEGSCLFFVLEPELKKLKLNPVLPKNDPLEMSFV